MRILENEIRRDFTVTIVQFLSMASIGTTVHVIVDDSETIYVHTVQTAKGVLEFCQHLYGEVKHLLRVYEVSTFNGENCNGIVVYCV